LRLDQNALRLDAQKIEIVITVFGMFPSITFAGFGLGGGVPGGGGGGLGLGGPSSIPPGT